MTSCEFFLEMLISLSDFVAVSVDEGELTWAMDFHPSGPAVAGENSSAINNVVKKDFNTQPDTSKAWNNTSRSFEIFFMLHWEDGWCFEIISFPFTAWSFPATQSTGAATNHIPAVSLWCLCDSDWKYNHVIFSPTLVEPSRFQQHYITI